MVRYDVLRSVNAYDFVNDAICLTSDDGSLRLTDGSPAETGEAYFYLVRGTNDCPQGVGPLGKTGSGEDRQGRNCP